jgi:peptidoglycan hydrolase-like protein with peptidoglycan-binding domain
LTSTNSLARITTDDVYSSLLALMFPWRRAGACLLLVVVLGILSCHHVSAARPAPAAGLHRHRHTHGAALRTSKHLRDARPGSRVAGLAELKSYLARFGYMHPGAGPHDDAFDGRTEAAVKRYQSRLSLPVTGRLDAATLGRMASPRCGIDDRSVSVPVPDSATSRFTFLDGEPRWPGNPGHLVLTYSISPTAPASVGYLPPEAVRAAFRSAFARWAEIIPVKFVETDDHYNRPADIRVSFYEGDHGDGAPFDGKRGVVAHAYGPEDGRLHFDAAEHWTVDVGSEAAGSWTMDLESVATHEIGHILGLGHSSSPEAVMYPYIDAGHRKVELSVDDIDGVQLLYGSNPLFSRHEHHAPAPPRRSDPSPPSASSPGRSWLAGSVSFAGVVLAMLVTHM